MEEKEKEEVTMSQADPEKAVEEELPVKTLPFAPNTQRVQPSILKIILMTLGTLAVLVLIGWIRSQIQL